MKASVLVSAGVALVVALLAVAATQLILPRPPAPVEPPSPATLDRAEVGEIVREYLLENPRILEEVIAALEEEQAVAEAEDQRQAIVENREALFESRHGFVAGNPDGDITLVEFFDYNCPYCRQMMPSVMELIEADPELRIVFRDWPVLGEESVNASRVALALKNLAPERFMELLSYSLW
jgi:protein-disulfide isomerase